VTGVLVMTGVHVVAAVMTMMGVIRRGSVTRHWGV
jgi:hypothetical protein